MRGRPLTFLIREESRPLMAGASFRIRHAHTFRYMGDSRWWGLRFDHSYHFNTIGYTPGVVRRTIRAEPLFTRWSYDLDDNRERSIYVGVHGTGRLAERNNETGGRPVLRGMPEQLKRRGIHGWRGANWKRDFIV